MLLRVEAEGKYYENECQRSIVSSVSESGLTLYCIHRNRTCS